MPVVDVVNLSGKKVGQVELADAIFGAKVNQDLLHEASRWYLRGLRRGTHKVKEKSEVSGDRIEPTRARPVPFCFQSLRPARGLDPVAALASWRHGPRTK